jgi:flagellum-specific peptidoglycan hydrolase FlgJ
MSFPFTVQVIQAAQQAQAKTGCLASVALAQYAEESDYGKLTPENSNNPFGIKARGDQSYVEASTREWNPRTQQYYTIKAKFAKYDNLSEGFIAHGLLLMNPHGPYYKALPFANNANAFTRAIAHIYATDPNYGQKLIDLIAQYKLTDYDTPAPQTNIKSVGDV